MLDLQQLMHDEADEQYVLPAVASPPVSSSSSERSSAHPTNGSSESESEFEPVHELQGFSGYDSTASRFLDDIVGRASEPERIRCTH